MTREEAIKVVKKLEEVCYFSDTETEGLHTLIPELAESEDERIRKQLIETIDSIENFPNKKAALSYLEKPELVRHPPIAYTYPSDASRDEQLKMALLALLNSDLIKVAGKFTKQDLIDWVEKQKEQKPASTEDMPYITDEHFNEREPADSFKYKLAEYMTRGSTKKESPDGYTYHISAETILEMAKEELLKRGVVQKPAEWSEEDEKRVKQLIYDTEFIKAHYEKRKEKLGEQFNNALIRDCDEQIAWLKSLRPSWKPSEVCYGAKGDPDPAGEEQEEPEYSAF